MGDSIGDVAKSWLIDPPWQKVFKHTFDVLEDYVSYILIAVGTIALSVRLLTTLGSGDLVCVIVGVQHNGTTGATSGLGPYTAGGTLAMVGYAQTDPSCIRAVFTPYLEYLPYIILLQSLVLVIVEKFTFKVRTTS